MIKIIVNDYERDYEDLFIAAGKEVNLGFDLDIHWELYKELIINGMYLFIGARDNGKPVGYIGVMLNNHLFKKDQVNALVDSFYVLPEYRKSTVAGRLLKTVMQKIKGKAYSMCFFCEETNPLVAMLKSRGFTELERSWRKIL